MPVERTFFLLTYGCTLNASDSQLIHGTLVRDGWTRVDAIDDASLIIVNTCGVKVPTEQKILHRIEAISNASPGKPLVIAGCLPAIYKGDASQFTAIAPSVAAVIGPRNYHDMGALADRVLAGERGLALLDGRTLDEKARLVAVGRAGHPGIVPVAEGCKGACTYCCTRFARGVVQSYPPGVLIKKYKDILDTGVKEVWLTAEDCSAYLDETTGVDLVGLLDELSSIDGDHVMRVGMMNPKTLIPILPRLVEMLAGRPRIFKFIHVPVQSGSDSILLAMNRGYTAGEFTSIIDTIRAKVPGITIATDMICGYPGETGDDFQATLALVERVKPDILNVSAYGHRPGTVASKLPALPSNVVKERTRIMAARQHAMTSTRAPSWIGWKGPAIVSEFNAQKQTWVARTIHYRPVVVDGERVPGDWVEVEITGAHPHYLVGKVSGPASPR